jgi:nucleoside-diphosphate-sugar epimerase
LQANDYVIAGGAGFIGSHIVRRLLSLGTTSRITVLDDFSTGSRMNLQHASQDRRLRILECNVAEAVPDIHAADVVLHLATCANPKDYEALALDTLRVNSQGTGNLLRLARENESRFVYFSSSEIYGDHDPMPLNGLDEESCSRIHLGKKRSCYVVGKAFGEELVRAYCSEYEVEHLIVRPFNVYGPNMDWNTPYGRVVPNFLRWAMMSEPLRVNGDGSQERSFCYIDDFLDCLFLLLNGQFPPERAVNIGNPEPTSILELANIVNHMTDNCGGVEFVDKYQFEPKYRTPDVRRVMEWTGWKPKTSLTRGLEKLIGTQERRETGEEVTV